MTADEDQEQEAVDDSDAAAARWGPWGDGDVDDSQVATPCSGGAVFLGEADAEVDADLWDDRYPRAKPPVASRSIAGALADGGGLEALEDGTPPPPCPNPKRARTAPSPTTRAPSASTLSPLVPRPAVWGFSNHAMRYLFCTCGLGCGFPNSLSDSESECPSQSVGPRSLGACLRAVDVPSL